MKNKEYDLRERKPATDDSDDESDREESDTEGLLNDDDAFNDDSGLEILQTDLPYMKITEDEARNSDELTMRTGQQPTDTREERNMQISSSHTPPQCRHV